MTTPPTPASEPAVLHTTPLHAVHRRLGAQFTEFAGWDMPVRYASEVAEHHAVRTAAGLFDLSHMGEIEVTGAGAAAALDPDVRTLLRVAPDAAPALARSLAQSLAVRSARREGGALRAQVDPPEVL